MNGRKTAVVLAGLLGAALLGYLAGSLRPRDADATAPAGGSSAISSVGSTGMATPEIAVLSTTPEGSKLLFGRLEIMLEQARISPDLEGDLELLAAWEASLARLATADLAVLHTWLVSMDFKAGQTELEEMVICEWARRDGPAAMQARLAIDDWTSVPFAAWAEKSPREAFAWLE